MLEAFHSLLLSYCPKRTAYRLVKITPASRLVNMTSRNEAYLARTQLAVLDHNAHCDRQVATTAKGEQRYHRKYRKQSKNWDVTPVKTRKEYKYIPELIAAIFQAHKESDNSLKSKKRLREDHPVHIQHTIAHRPPDHTADIATKKRSRFSD